MAPEEILEELQREIGPRQFFYLKYYSFISITQKL